jgi:hypothetical protein
MVRRAHIHALLTVYKKKIVKTLGFGLKYTYIHTYSYNQWLSLILVSKKY